MPGRSSPLSRSQDEQPAGQHGPRVARRHHRTRLSPADHFKGHAHGRVALAPHRLARVIMHGDHLGAVADGNIQVGRAEALKISGRSRDSLPSSTTREPRLRTASTAPATSGPGAASPPMASMAITAATTSRFQLMGSRRGYSGRWTLPWAAPRRALPWPSRTSRRSHTRDGACARRHSSGREPAGGTGVFIHCARRESRRAFDCLLLGTAISKSLQVELQFDGLKRR